jgi:hypothetical protein
LFVRGFLFLFEFFEFLFEVLSIQCVRFVFQCL